jgi:hypothetical protein
MEKLNKGYSCLSDLIAIVSSGNVIKATKYISEKFVITATRKRYRGKILKGETIDIVLKIGRPNFAEREFIKLCKKAKESFPIKKMQIKMQGVNK